MRIQNEGAGKSSWWVINPDAKPGKAPRRPRAGSMDSKSMMKTSRDRAMKKVREVREMKNKGLLNKDGTISPGMRPFSYTLWFKRVSLVIFVSRSHALWSVIALEML